MRPALGWTEEKIERYCMEALMLAGISEGDILWREVFDAVKRRLMLIDCTDDYLIRQGLKSKAQRIYAEKRDAELKNRYGG